MNFAYDKVKDGKGWSKPLKDMRAQLGGLDYFNDLYTPVIELHYWADDSNIIAVDEALKSDKPFIYPLRYQSFPYTPKEWRRCNRFRELSTELVESINNGQCKFVLDDLRENTDWAEIGKYLVEKLQEAMIDPKNVIVLTMGHTYTYEEFPFKIIHWNFFESYIRSQIKDDFRPKKDTAKKFLCLARHPKDFRANFVRQMWDRGILDQFNVSLGKVEGDDEFARNTPIYYDTRTVHDGSLGFKAITGLDLQHQEESYINIVLESIYHSPQMLSNISEKTWKPIAMKMPFIMVGMPYTLRRLRDLGYQTFPWDESYDEIEDPEERMSAIVNLVSHLNSCKDFKDIIKSCESIVKHNFDLIKLRRPEHAMVKALSE